MRRSAFFITTQGSPLLNHCGRQNFATQPTEITGGMSVPLSNRQKNSLRVQKLIDFFRAKGTLFPDQEELDMLLHEMGVISEKRTRLLLVYARKYARRVPLTATQRQMIREHIRQSNHPANVALLQEEIRTKFDIPKTLIQNIISNHALSSSLKSITKEQRQLVQDHLKQSLHPHNISLLCDELEKKTKLPKPVLHKMLINRSFAHFREKISNEQLALLRNHIENSEHPENAPLLCDELQESFSGIPRSFLYRLICDCSDSVATRRLGKDQRSMVKEHVERSSGKNVSILCDEIQNQLPSVPRGVLRRLIYNHLSSLAVKQVTEKQRCVIRDLLNDSTSDKDISTLCDTLQDKIDAPRQALHYIVREELKHRRACIKE